VPDRRTQASGQTSILIELLLTVAFGALHGVPMAHPAWWALQPLALAWLAWRVGRAAPGRAAVLGWLFGISWLVSSVWWLFISMHDHGNLPAWMAGGAVLALCGALSLYLALAMGLFARWRRHRWVGDSLLFAALWLLAEWARGRIFTGFPWAASGYAHVDSPLAVLAPWIGVYGLGAVVALGVASLALRSDGPAARRRWGLAVGFLAAGLGAQRIGPPEFTSGAGSLFVALMQNNVPQQEKFSAAHLFDVLDWTRDKLIGLPVDLVVAPETVIPLLPEQVPPDFWPPLRAHFTRAGRHALLGLPLGDPQAGYTNSVAGLSARALETPEGFYRYDKHHLVPFGEFIPTGFRWFTNLMQLPLGDFNRGVLSAPSFEVRTEHGTQWVAPNVCYEDLFGEELAARFVGPQPAPTILANLSNIAWFGDSVAIQQHLQISRMRSLELQRPMLRATNTGATAIIDHRGEVQDQLPPSARGVLGGHVEGREGLTPFSRWAGRWGLWPAVLLALAVVAGQALRPRRRKAFFGR
jgi:apolipoprotein N-acyltransferase